MYWRCRATFLGGGAPHKAKSHACLAGVARSVFGNIMFYEHIIMPNRRRLLLALLLLADGAPTSRAQQSAAGQDTLIGIVGRDFVMIGADTSSSGGGGISLTSSDVDKIALVHDGWRRWRMASGSGGGSGNSNEEEEDDGGDDGGRTMGRRRRRLDDDDYFDRASSEQQAIAVGFAGDAADGERARRRCV